MSEKIKVITFNLRVAVKVDGVNYFDNRLPRIIEFLKAEQPDVKSGFDLAPKNCPVCGTPLVKDEDEAKHFCPNSDLCPPQIKGKFIHFVGRKAMDINAGEACDVV